MGRRDFRMHGATPKGRSRSYTYYASDRKINGAQIHVPTGIVDEQILKLLESIGVEPRALPRIRELYHEHIRKLKGPSIGEQIAELQARLQRLYEEEANLARRYAVLDLSDKTYELVHREWQDKVFEIQKQISGLESSTEDIATDLDHALRLLVRIPKLFPRLRTIDQGRLLRILFRRIIIDTQGKVIDFEMYPPFAYLSLLNNPPPEKPPKGGNEPIIWAGLRCFQPELLKKAAQSSGLFASQSMSSQCVIERSSELSPQLTAFFTSALIFASSVAVNSFSA